MMNGGIINRTSTGMYTLLPLGMKALDKLIRLIDKEMKYIGGQNILLPILTSSDLWKKTSRLQKTKSELFMLHDRRGKEYLLNPTCEEAITNLIFQIGPLKRSQLPLRLYQTSSKLRDEMKPRLGLLRSREFIMTDMYTFDLNVETATHTYEVVNKAYDRILKNIGIPYFKILADGGITGGSISHEYHYISELGDDCISICKTCNHIDKTITESYCFNCKAILDKRTSVEVGHTFFLGTKYSEPLNATFIDNKNKLQFLVMGCYGLGLTRIMASVIENLSTDRELRWPLKLAPYTVCIIPPKKGSKEESISEIAYNLYSELEIYNIDVIVDDRIDMTIGKRLLQARKSGYPFVIVVGNMYLNSTPLIEVHNIYEATSVNLKLEDVTKYLNSIIHKFDEP